MKKLIVILLVAAACLPGSSLAQQKKQKQEKHKQEKSRTVKLACSYEWRDGTHGTDVYLFDGAKLLLDGHKSGDVWKAEKDEVMLTIDDATIKLVKDKVNRSIVYQINRIDGSYEIVKKSLSVEKLASGKCTPLKQAF